MEIDTDKKWWVFGNYIDADCENCGRRRVMSCEDNDGKERIICEKCAWEPAANDFCYEAIDR